MALPQAIRSFIDTQADRAPGRYDDLRAMIFSGTLPRMLKDAGGIPAYGNSTRDWNLEQPDHPNPEYR